MVCDGHLQSQESLPATPRRPPRTGPAVISLVPQNVDALALAVLVLEAVDTCRVELADGGQVVGPLVLELFLCRARGVERLEVPPSVFLRFAGFRRQLSERDYRRTRRSRLTDLARSSSVTGLASIVTL